MAKIDLSYLESVAGGDQDFIKQMLEMFKASTLPELEKIDTFYQKKDWMMITSLAHKVKAPLQMLSQSSILEKVQQIEKNSKDKADLDKIPLLLSEAINEMKLLHHDVDALISTMK